MDMALAPSRSITSCTLASARIGTRIRELHLISGISLNLTLIWADYLLHLRRQEGKASGVILFCHTKSSQHNFRISMETCPVYVRICGRIRCTQRSQCMPTAYTRKQTRKMRDWRNQIQSKNTKECAYLCYLCR